MEPSAATGRPSILLVHGSHHGAWCWDFLVPELESLGWRVQAVDLPVSDADIGASGYVDSIVSQVAQEPMVVVGHSMAGVVIPLLVDRLPVLGLVFLNAITPVIGKSAIEQFLDEPDARGTAADGLGSYVDGLRHPIRDGARELYYHDCPPDLTDWALDRLVPQGARVMTETTPLTEWPAVPSVAILGLEDRAVPYEWASRALVDRLGNKALTIPGGHSPFLARPQLLALVVSQAVVSLVSPAEALGPTDENNR